MIYHNLFIVVIWQFSILNNNFVLLFIFYLFFLFVTFQLNQYRTKGVTIDLKEERKPPSTEDSSQVSKVCSYDIKVIKFLIVKFLNVLFVIYMFTLKAFLFVSFAKYFCFTWTYFVKFSYFFFPILSESFFHLYTANQFIILFVQMHLMERAAY